uniref:Cysteine-rich venom protein n=1 Tax=Scolopendra subspinipes TaxID=55038 RepID=A0A5B9CT23_SCOSU|nr:venom allergen [Scolopendra subspinipes]
MGSFTIHSLPLSPLLQLLLLVFLSSSVLSCKYSRFSPQHTMCKQPSPTCAIKVRGLTQQEKNFVLHAHNDFRRKVANGSETRLRQPPASNMMMLKWDEELAQLAQKHAENCKFEHDCPKCREVDRFPVGQNIYMRSSSREDDKVTWDTILDGWYDEVALFPPRTVDSFAVVPGTLHYAQMVWAETTQVGCGFTHFKDKLWRKLFVCNYGPTGNWLEEPVYYRGKPCSQCDPGFKCSSKYPGLCA